MKSLLLSVLAFSTVALAVEPVKLPMEVGTLKTREGKVLEGVKIVGADAVGVKVIHSGGTARLPYERLPKELAARFPRDAGAAKKQLEKEARQEEAHDRSMDQAEAREKEDAESEEADEGGDTAVEGSPELAGSTKARIASLESYVKRLEAGIVKSRDLASKARERAQGIRQNARMMVRDNSPTGNGRIYEVENRSKIKRAEFQEKRAEREEAKVAEADALIATARAKIEVLKQTPAE